LTLTGDGHVRPSANTEPWPTMQATITNFLQRQGILKQ
jgi:hypothetical protein